MQELFEKFIRKVNSISLQHTRALLFQLNSKERIIGIRGARGVGKTTLLLQYAKKHLPLNEQTLYVSLDDLYFTKNTLYGLADNFIKDGGRYLLLDEVHKYKNWSLEIKNIYDDFKDVKVIFTGSSMLSLDASLADLSRRIVMYYIQGLSFREFIFFYKNVSLEKYSISDLLKHHISITEIINKKIKPLQLFKQYIQWGYYPYFLDNQETYLHKLAQTIQLIIDTDLPARYDISYGSLQKIKKLLYLVASSVPYIPNIQKLSEQTTLTRNATVQFIHYLAQADVFNLLQKQGKGNSLLQKPDKIYLHHPNLMFAIAKEFCEMGTLRESFFMNQLQYEHIINYTDKGDFLVDNKYVVEVGGKNKETHQLYDIKNAFFALDDIETGFKNKIPLWLFGFLY